MNNNIYDVRNSRVLCVGMVLLFGLMAGCAQREVFDAEKQPAWVDGSSQKYLSEDFFVGKGKASELQVAASRAKKDLADIFPDIESPLQTGQFKQFLQKAEVVDAWFDITNQQHYALVVIKRESLNLFVERQLALMDTKTIQQIKIATKGVDPIFKIGATRRALAMILKRAELLEMIKSLGGKNVKNSAVWTPIELKIHLQYLMRDIDIRPGEVADRQLSSAIVRGLDAAGFLSTRAEASYTLKSSLERTGMKWKDGWFTEQGMLTIELLDGDNQVRGSAEWPFTVQERERFLINKTLMSKVASTLEEELGEVIMEMIEK